MQFCYDVDVPSLYRCCAVAVLLWLRPHRAHRLVMRGAAAQVLVAEGVVTAEDLTFLASEEADLRSAQHQHNAINHNPR